MTEYEKFKAWVIATYGSELGTGTAQSYRHLPRYQEWVQTGRPGAGVAGTKSLSETMGLPSSGKEPDDYADFYRQYKKRHPLARDWTIQAMYQQSKQSAFTTDIGEEEFYQKPDISWKPPSSPNQPAFDLNIQEEPAYQKPGQSDSKIGGYTPDEWAMGLPEMDWKREQAQLGLEQSREQFEWEKQKWAQQMALQSQNDINKQWQEKLQRQSTERQLREAEETNIEMRKAWANPQNFLPVMASTYDEWKARMLSSLAGPRNWLMKRDLETRANPYISALGAGQDTVGMGMARLNTPVPQGLANFVPSLRGQSAFNIKDESLGPAEAPSGQMWTAASPTQREYLKGYMDWVGQNVGDTLAYSQSMAPETPNIAGGWKPKRQY